MSDKYTAFFVKSILLAAKNVSKTMDAKFKFKTHGGTDLEDTFFTSFSIFTFGVKAGANAAASELKKPWWGQTQVWSKPNFK